MDRMKIIVAATPDQQAAFVRKGIAPGVDVHFGATTALSDDTVACFDLQYEDCGAAFPSAHHIPVFVNAVLADAADMPENFIRINAWNTFLERDVMEIAVRKGSMSLVPAVKVLDTLGWKYIEAPDAPGMVAARSVAMIINEAYFGLGDRISSRNDIDTAMKLGTNYPYGPFEWAEKTGVQKIHALLSKLAAQDPRYSPAPALTEEINRN